MAQCAHPRCDDGDEALHVEGCPRLKTCPRCGAGAQDDGRTVKYAIWLRGIGWVVDACAGGETSDRLYNARWFNDDAEVDAAIAEMQIERDQYEVVWL